jgi:hypothetical protein
MKSYNQKDYAPADVLVQDLGPDRAQIAAIFAHALLTKGATKSVIAKEAVEMADELIKELGK